VGGKHVNKRDTVSSLPSHFKNSDFLYSVVNYSDFANNPNKDEIKELLQPRSPAFGRGVASAFSGAGALRPCPGWTRDQPGEAFPRDVLRDRQEAMLRNIATFILQPSLELINKPVLRCNNLGGYFYTPNF
jgi:hypothetical protein